MSTTPEQPPETATPKQVLAQRELARRQLLAFTTATHPAYEAGWVHEDICARLVAFSQAVARRESPRLMLLMPPRHGKSELASIRFPAWHLGRHPSHEVINVGYNLDLPMDFSKKVRALVRTPEYGAIFPGMRLDPDSQGAERWATTKEGAFTAAGVGGGITGKGAHILIIDDPIKNIKEADSSMVREDLEKWYQSTAYTRLAPGGGVLLIETWWNDDDLAGRLQARMRAKSSADQFDVVKYPAISEQWEYRDEATLRIMRSDTMLEGTTLTLLRSPGESLHKARYDLPALVGIRDNVEPRVWSALYQQNPVPDMGMYFKLEYLRYHRALPDPRELNIFMAWDFAVGEKTQNDFTVGAVLGQDAGDNLYVLEIVRLKADTLVIIEAILDTSERWSRGKDHMLGFEGGQIFLAMRPMLEKRMAERRQYVSYEVLTPMSDKLARARPLQGRLQQGRVIFPEEAVWLSQATQEMLRFPAGANDDVVDAIAWAVILCMNKPPPPVRELPRAVSWKEKLQKFRPSNTSHLTS